MDINIETNEDHIMKVLVTKEPKVFIYSQNKQKYSEGYHKVKKGIESRFYVITNYNKDSVTYMKIIKLENVPQTIDNLYFETIN